MQYNTSSNDYYAAYNRRFDARIKKLWKYGLLGQKDGQCFVFLTQYDKAHNLKPIACSANIMHGSNRYYYEFIAKLLPINAPFLKS